MTFLGGYESFVLATHNEGKVEEITSLLQPFAIQYQSASSLKLPDVDETGTTYIENAYLKAKSACDLSGLPALADDSGVSVNALGGSPGIYTGRWAGPKRDFSIAMQRVEDELQGLDEDADRSVDYVCVLCMAWPNGSWQVFEGVVSGLLVWPPRGDKGFGFEPMFLPDGETQTYGEMEPAQKYATNARAIAFKRFSDFCLRGV